MSAHSVRLKFEDGGVIYISSSRARQLPNGKAADVVSRRPFVLKLKKRMSSDEFLLQRWTSVSEGMPMSGRLLERNPPRP